jgi:hypothetical protein
VVIWKLFHWLPDLNWCINLIRHVRPFCLRLHLFRCAGWLAPTRTPSLYS